MQRRPYTAEDEIDLRDVVRTLWRHRWVIGGITTAAALVAAVVSVFVLPPVYESRVLIQLSDQSAPVYASPQAAARVLMSPSFLQPIATRFGIGGIGELERMVRVDPVRDTRMIQVRIRDKDPHRLRMFTNAVVREFLRRASEQVDERRRLIRQRLQQLDVQLREVQATLRITQAYIQRFQRVAESGSAQGGFSRSFLLNALSLSEGLYDSLLNQRRALNAELITLEPPVLVQPPYIPDEPVSPRPALNAAIAAVLGFMFSTVGVLIRSAWITPAELPRVQTAASAESDP